MKLKTKCRLIGLLGYLAVGGGLVAAGISPARWEFWLVSVALMVVDLVSHVAAGER